VFDREYHRERPIPSGAISLKLVWALGMAWVVLGAAALFFAGPFTGALGLGLVFCILLYDAIHKRFAFAPVLMAACRFFLYVCVASTGVRHVTGESLWCGLALAAYIVGLSYLARRESTRGAILYWPIGFLAAPIVLALILNAGSYRENALLLSAVMALWALKSMRYFLWSPEPNIGRTVSGLLAGIVFVDWLAMADAPREFGVIFLGLFAAALLLQRFVPAT
jgi:heme O synthase-like polyprenyltransferase